jgi:hypothetical protein
MSIQLNSNLKIAAPASADKRYLSERTLSGSPLPYSATTEVFSTIPLSERHSGLTVFITTGGTNLEFWFKDGVSNGSLIQKKYDSVIQTASFVTGATNLGFFTGQTGIQVLPITHLTLPAQYSGNYALLYNFYYRGTDGIIHIGVPADNIPKRGYVKTTAPVQSWLWNDDTSGSLQVGWLLVNGDISLEIGQAISGVAYYPPATAYVNTSWTNISYNNGSNVVIGTVLGSLTTGSTISIGGPHFAFKEHNNLHLRTLMTKTPNLIAISYDEAFIYLSGTTANAVINASNGLNKIGTTVRLGGTLTGTTTITDARIASGRTGIEYGGDYSASYTDRSLVDRGYVKSVTSTSTSGQRVTKFICQVAHGFNVQNVVGWSGGTYNKAIANGLYDGEVIGLVTKCYNADCFDLTQEGYVTGLTGLATSTTYFLSDVTAGLMTSTQPVVNGHIVKSVMIADSAVSGWVLPYAGYIISSGTGGPLVKSVCNPTGATYQMLQNDFYVGACCGTLIILPLAPPTGMVAVVADISCLAAANPITIAGPLSNGQVQSQINSNSGSLSYIFNGNKWSVFAFVDTPVPV